MSIQLDTGFKIIIILSICVIYLIILWLRSKKNEIKILEICKIISANFAKVVYGDFTSAIDIPKKLNVKYFKKIFEELKVTAREFNDITAEPLKRILYVGPDSYFEGRKCGSLMAEYCKGNDEVAVIIAGNLAINAQNMRYKGFSSVLKENFPEMKIVELFEAFNDDKKGYDFTQILVKKHMNLKGIYVTGSSLAPVIARSIVDSKKDGNIFLIVHDLNEDTAKHIRNNVITASLLQDPIAQGFDPVVHLFNYLTEKWSPEQPRLITAMEVVTKENLNQFWDNKLIKTKEMIEREVKPIAKADKKIKILILTQDWMPFFLQIASGSIDAMNKLKAYNAEVQAITFNQARRSEEEIKKEIEIHINKAIEEKIDGIILPVFYKYLVPYLNKAADHGISIATFNTELMSIRSMFDWLNQSSVEIKKICRNFSDAINHINNAMDQFSATTIQMVKSITIQNESARRGIESSSRLSEMIESVVDGEQKQMNTVQESANISNNVSELIQQFNKQLNNLKKIQVDVNYSAEKGREMREYSKNIESILKNIEDISIHTNTLALNASIEAARAGNAGTGFKIVSNEIRKLALNSKKSASDVAVIIKNMQNIISESVELMNNNEHEIALEVESISRASDDMTKLSQELVNTMDKVKSVAGENSQLTQKMKDSSVEMLKVINETSAISEENTAAIEELSAATSEISNLMKRSTNQIDQLTKITLVLQGSTAQFKTDVK